MNGMAGLGVFLSVALFLLGLVVAILWICMPFAIFGTKPLLRELIAEQRRTNQYLAAAATVARDSGTFDVNTREGSRRVEPT